MIVAVLNPYRLKGEFRGKSVLFRIRYIVFSFSVKCMQYLYRRYAYCDSIDMGYVRILQTCRDEEFENWLKLIGKDIKPHFEVSKTDTSFRKSVRSSMLFSGFFRFERQLTVTQNNKIMVINHSPKPLVYSEIAGTLKKSCSNDIMNWTEFKSNSVLSCEAYSKQQDNSQIGDRQTPNHKVSIGKIMSPKKIEPIVPELPPCKKMRGVEIDESF